MHSAKHADDYPAPPHFAPIRPTVLRLSLPTAGFSRTPTPSSSAVRSCAEARAEGDLFFFNSACGGRFYLFPTNADGGGVNSIQDGRRQKKFPSLSSSLVV